jgi:ubiquinone/menaquinone biosynthesis C-methylase UbiE
LDGNPFIAKDEDSYRYLAESIRMHPKQDALKEMMQNAGLERCEYFNIPLMAVKRDQYLHLSEGIY